MTDTTPEAEAERELLPAVLEAATIGDSVGVDAESVLDLAMKVKPVIEIEEGLYAILQPSVGDGAAGYSVVSTEQYGASPRRAKATRTVGRVESFVQYLERHGTDSTEVFADLRGARVVGVIDSHHRDLPGWEGHRVSLVLEQSVAWQTWTAHNGQWLDQLAFAELIEQRMIDVADPDGGTLLEIVQSFHATTDVQFKSGTRLNSGEIQFTYEETQEARAGRKGDLTIPDHFVLVMRPYVGGPAYRIRASLRYRVKPDGIKLGFVLERPEEVLEAAFKDVVGIIRDGAEATDERPAVQPITAPMFYGQP